MDAEDLVVNHSGERQAVEGTIDVLPDGLAKFVAESLFALVQEGLLLVVFLPTIDLRQQCRQYRNRNNLFNEIKAKKARDVQSVNSRTITALECKQRLT